MKNKLIALARSICKARFMDYPDYDEDVELDLSDALTILVSENIEHTNEFDIDTSELYEFFSNGHE